MAAADRTVLLRQIARLAAVPAAAAPEAVVFYAARTLEGAAAGIVKRLRGDAATNCLSNLLTLETYRLLDAVFKELAHTLRRMGNDVRHRIDDAREADVRLSIVLARETVAWHGRLEGGSADDAAAETLAGLIAPDWPVLGILDLLKAADAGSAAAVDGLVARRDEALASRFVVTLVIDALIAKRRLAEAESLIDDGLKLYAKDPRLQQQRALLYSRTGRLDEAVKCAKDLLQKYADDDETKGICGGIYKRCWDRERAEKGAAASDKPLRTAHELYFKQWEAGKKLNAYLGVNAATTAALLGRVDDAKAIAAAVAKALDARDAQLARTGFSPQDGGGVLAYYDEASRAEAILLSGDAARAAEVYALAFARFPTLTGAIEGTRAQARNVAAALRLEGFEI